MNGVYWPGYYQFTEIHHDNGWTWRESQIHTCVIVIWMWDHVDSIKFLEQVSVHHVHSWQTDSAILVKNCHQTVSTNRHEKCTTGINFIYVTLLVLIDGKEIPPPHWGMRKYIFILVRFKLYPLQVWVNQWIRPTIFSQNHLGVSNKFTTIELR